MSLPQEGKVSIIKPHSMWQQLVTLNVFVIYQHLCEAEGCNDGFEKLSVGKEEESGQNGHIVHAKDAHGPGGVVTGCYDDSHQQPQVQREDKLQPMLLIGVHARIEASLHSKIQVDPRYEDRENRV